MPRCSRRRRCRRQAVRSCSSRGRCPAQRRTECSCRSCADRRAPPGSDRGRTNDGSERRPPLPGTGAGRPRACRRVAGDAPRKPVPVSDVEHAHVVGLAEREGHGRDRARSTVGAQARVAELADAEGLNPSAPDGGVRVRSPPRAPINAGVRTPHGRPASPRPRGGNPKYSEVGDRRLDLLPRQAMAEAGRHMDGELGDVPSATRITMTTSDLSGAPGAASPDLAERPSVREHADAAERVGEVREVGRGVGAASASRHDVVDVGTVAVSFGIRLRGGRCAVAERARHPLQRATRRRPDGWRPSRQGSPRTRPRSRRSPRSRWE